MEKVKQYLFLVMINVTNMRAGGLPFPENNSTLMVSKVFGTFSVRLLKTNICYKDC